MTAIQAAILGVFQGLGEFLPISSSAHLVLLPWLFGWTDPGLTFDIALHLGTLIAVVVYFWKDWWTLIIKGFTDLRSVEGRLFWYLAAATVPGAIGGFLLEKEAESTFRSPLLIALMLIVVGILLYWADHRSVKKIQMSGIGFGTSIVIGISQIFAIIPGVSRSGITMSAALLLGVTRVGSARFSFLLSTPIILGAALLKIPHLISNTSLITPNFAIGTLVSCVAGIVSINFLLKYIQNRDFLPFVWYRLIVGAFVILFVAIG